MTVADALLAAIGEARGAAAADRLCRACVELLGVDAAAISLLHDGVGDGVDVVTLGASDPTVHRYDELQFVLGEGPCLDAVIRDEPVVMFDLADPAQEARWPAFGAALLEHHIRGVCAVPILVAGERVGALQAFHVHPPAWTVDQIIGLAEAADLAQIPVLDLLGGDLHAATNAPGSDGWTELNALVRTEVSQATGVLMAQLNLTAAAALARLRAHAYATGRSATTVARDIIDHRLRLPAD